MLMKQPVEITRVVPKVTLIQNIKTEKRLKWKFIVSMPTESNDLDIISMTYKL